MMGRPDSEPVKRPASTSVEDLRTSLAADREQAVGTLGLSWVGVCDGQMYSDWLTQVDKNEAPGIPVVDPDAGEHEMHFERDVRDDKIALELQVPADAFTQAKREELQQLRAMGTFTMVSADHPANHGDSVVVGTKRVVVNKGDRQ